MRSVSLFSIASVALAGAVAALVGGAPAKTAPKQAPPAHALTYARDIAPILDRNCATCHHAGEVAPFALTGYGDVKPRAAFIAAVTQSRYMPPWKADSHGEFADERRLTDAQIAEIKQWSDAGAPQGDPAAAPPAPHFAGGWALGAPDAEFRPTRSYTLAADGGDVYRCFVMPTHFGADRWVTAMQVRPGDAKVVHHVIAYLDTHGAAQRLAAQSRDGNPGYTSFGGVGFAASGSLGGWAPGNDPHPLPAGVGILLPKDADIVLQVHYHKDGKPETDLTRIGLYFAKGPVDKRLRVLPLVDLALHIPAGDKAYAAQATQAVGTDVTLLEVMPHMHLLGHTMAVTADLPGGATQPLVKVPDWDFNWQSTYVYKQPVHLPRGSRVRMTATFDNSASNPRNPSSPPKLVTWGEQTTDEMCIAFLFYTVDSEHLTRGVSGDASDWTHGSRAQLLDRFLLLFDKNGDGKLDAGERLAMQQFIQDQQKKRLLMTNQR